MDYRTLIFFERCVSNAVHLHYSLFFFHYSFYLTRSFSERAK
nr:MAG TPA: hypothetical protein [Caudoviricetes sp.]